MPSDVDQRYRPRGGGMQRELQVGLDGAFLAVPRRPSDLWVRTLDLACKVMGSRPAHPRVASKPRGSERRRHGVVTERRLAFR
jgi:hypothetical protein